MSVTLPPPLPTVGNAVLPPAEKKSSLVKNVALFGVLGAAAASALTLTGLPIIGGMFLPIAAAVGGAVGVGIGAAKHLLTSRGRSGPDQIHTGSGLLPPSGIAPPPLPRGAVMSR